LFLVQGFANNTQINKLKSLALIKSNLQRPCSETRSKKPPRGFFGDDKSTVVRLLNTLPQTGRLKWIDRCPVRREHLLGVEEIMVKTDAFPGGDHARLKPSGKRQIILMQHKRPAAAGFLGVIGIHSAGPLAPQFGGEQPQLTGYHKPTGDH